MRTEFGVMSGNAFLAIWSDVPRDRETDYLHWLTREHISERLSVEGFVGVRVYRELRRDICRYFIHYRLASSSVLTSDAYLQRLNEPTPWSQRIMPILGNFARGGGRVLAEVGSGHGCLLAAVKLDPRTEEFDRGFLQKIVACDLIIAARLMETDMIGTTVATREKTMRANDIVFPGLLLIEGLDGSAITEAVRSCGLPVDELYTEIFNL